MKKQATITTVLVAPLNWGLGHATRCIPIINCLLSKNTHILIASDGAALELLKKEFPTLESFVLPGYNVRYPFGNMTVNMLLQLPKIQRAIWKEHNIIQQLVAEQDIQIIISDNRFGCYTPMTYNVFMTHQLNIMAPFSVAEKITAKWNKKMLGHFDLCWIPDLETLPGLAGRLSHPSPTKPVRYIGPLSRMKALEADQQYDAIVVLSGPEPQRSRLEELILQQAVLLPYQFLLVRGLMKDKSEEQQQRNITIIGHLTSTALELAIAKSTVVIARSGYTTIMDLVALNKKAMLIPTPGQTEQIYLGDLFADKKGFVVQSQKDLNLDLGLKCLDAQLEYGAKIAEKNNLLDFVDELLQTYSKAR